MCGFTKWHIGRVWPGPSAADEFTTQLRHADLDFGPAPAAWVTPCMCQMLLKPLLLLRINWLFKPVCCLKQDPGPAAGSVHVGSAPHTTDPVAAATKQHRSCTQKRRHTCCFGNIFGNIAIAMAIARSSRCQAGPTASSRGTCVHAASGVPAVCFESRLSDNEGLLKFYPRPFLSSSGSPMFG